jgi:transposase-like protein
MGVLQHVEDALKAKRIFRRARTDDWVRALGIVLYHLGLSLRDTSLVLDNFEPRSHEAVRQWYERARFLFEVRTVKRRALAVDETKVKVQGKWMYVWAAIDVDTWEVVAAWASFARSFLESYSFIRKVLKACENRPLFYVDRGPWYRYALDRMGLPWEHRTFGPRNPIEQWFGILKQRIKRFYKRWPHNADLVQVNEWIQSYVACYHIKRGWSSLS